MARSSSQAEARTFLRHCVATLAYRGGKVLKDVPPGFDQVRAADSSRTAGQILGHICDLLVWALSAAKGKPVWREQPVASWNAGVNRFFTSLGELDSYLRSRASLGSPAERIFQGPIADALTHVGQIAMLRRLAGSPVKAENYFAAKIAVGRLGQRQSKPVAEFD